MLASTPVEAVGRHQAPIGPTAEPNTDNSTTSALLLTPGSSYEPGRASAAALQGLRVHTLSVSALSSWTRSTTLARLLLAHEGEDATPPDDPTGHSSEGAPTSLTGRALLRSGRLWFRCCFGDVASVRGRAVRQNRPGTLVIPFVGACRSSGARRRLATAAAMRSRYSFRGKQCSRAAATASRVRNRPPAVLLPWQRSGERLHDAGYCSLRDCDHADGRARTIAPGAEGPADAVERDVARRLPPAPPTRLLHRRAEAVVRQPRRANRGRAKPDSSAPATTNKRPRSSRTRTTGRPRRRAGCAPSPLSATPMAGPVRQEANDQLMARYGLTAAMLRQGPQVRGARRVVRFEP